jgi:hypothetical protein
VKLREWTAGNPGRYANGLVLRWREQDLAGALGNLPLPSPTMKVRHAWRIGKGEPVMVGLMLMLPETSFGQLWTLTRVPYEGFMEWEVVR